jgi:hypothetical protein
MSHAATHSQRNLFGNPVRCTAQSKEEKSNNAPMDISAKYESLRDHSYVGTIPDCCFPLFPLELKRPQAANCCALR